jgi:hypothetical protein
MRMHTASSARATPSAIPTGGGLYKSGGRKDPRRASVAAPVAHDANMTALATAILDRRAEVRARHKTRKIAMTTATVNATMMTARRLIDMLLATPGTPMPD